MTLARIASGKGHRYELDGKPVPGVTTVLNDGFPKPALINWAANETAAYAVNHWDELTELQVAERLRMLERSRFVSQREAALRGTDVHALAHRLAAGEEVDVPEAQIGHVDAYLRFAAEWQPRELLVEAVVANRAWHYAGTLDLIATLRDGHNWLLDFKTSGKGIYPDTALQLAGYRNAEFFVGPDGQEVSPLPRVDRCGVVWLRADGYDLVPLEVTEDTFYTFVCCLRVAQFRKLPNDFTVKPSLQPLPEETAA